MGADSGIAGPVGVTSRIISQRIDILSKDLLKRYRLFEDLKNWDLDYFNVLFNHGVLKTEAEKKHYGDHWFDRTDDSNWWMPPQEGEDAAGESEEENVNRYEKISRVGLIEGLEACITLDKPMVTYWILGLQNFRVYVCWSDQQVTRLLLTPMREEANVGIDFTKLTTREPIRVVRYLDKKYHFLDTTGSGAHLGEQLLYTVPSVPDGEIGVLRHKGEPDDFLYD